MNWWIAGIAGALSGLAGSLGIGGGGILIVFLTIFTQTPQLNAQGINLMFFIPVALLSILIYWKQKLLKPRVILATAALGIVGVFIGVPLADLLGNGILRKIFAGILILLGLKEFFCKPKTEQ